MRQGDTGIGHTIEQELGLEENNIDEPDLGKIELKTKRNGSTNRVTMFTFNRGVWQMKQSDLVNKYGYLNRKSRIALKSTVIPQPNNQGFYTKVNSENKQLELWHIDGNIIGIWKTKHLIETFNRKMPNLIIVNADSRIRSDGKEEFLYNKAFYLENGDEQSFMNFMADGTIIVEFRMHLKESGSVRNRGTGFRISENRLENCFQNKKSLIIE